MKMHKEKNDLLILDTPTAVQVFLFLAYLVNYAKVIALKGKARKHQKLLHFRLLFFLTKKSYISLLLCSAMNCDEKVLFLCFAHASSSSKILEVTCTEMNLERL